MLAQRAQAAVGFRHRSARALPRDMDSVSYAAAVVERLCGPTTLAPDVKLLAVRCGLTLMAGERKRESLSGERVYYDARQQPDVQDRQVARCVARYALHRMAGSVRHGDVQQVTESILSWAGVSS